MNKQDNKLAVSVVATLTAGITLIYTLIMYRTIIFAVAGVSALFLITAFILTQNIIAFVTMKNKSMNVHIKNCIGDISNQLETMNGIQTQLGKATFLYTRQAAQKVTTLENNYTESQEALYKNLAALSSIQNKATKLMIKYDQNNTNKLISSIKDMRNTLSETMINGFDQIQPDNTEVVATLESIVDYLKSQANSGDQALGMQLSNLAHELQNISNSIQRVQIPATGMVQPAPFATMPPVAAQSAATNMTDESSMMEELLNSFPPAAAPEQTEEVPAMEEMLSEEMPMMETSVPEEIPVMEDSVPEEMPIMEEAVPEEIPAMEEEIAQEAPVTPIADKGANDMLNPDEIAALFASADPAPKKVEEPAAEEPEEEEPFKPTFTVVGKSDETTETSVPTLADIPDDPNKQLSPDEIAALFASADPAPKKAPAPEPIPAAPAEDPNKQLSPDEIAALFAAADPAPKKEDEPTVEEKEMDAALASATPAPVSDDPNKQLSPDEIAALFASMG